MRVVITGAEGRLGRVLRTIWSKSGTLGFEPIWSSRQRDMVWDIGSGHVPDIPKGAIILHLAGVLRGDPAALSANSGLALTVCAAAAVAGAGHVFLASSAAIYGPGVNDHVEVQAPAPQTDYGRAKRDMEREALCWAHRSGPDAPGITCLRIGNVLGYDTLFGGAKAGQGVILDPVPGQPDGPIRSYIGPAALAQVLARLAVHAAAGVAMPLILNIAAPAPVGMADLLRAARIPFQFGKPNARVIPKVSLSTRRLATLVPLEHADAAAMVADWRNLTAGAA